LGKAAPGERRFFFPLKSVNSLKLTIRNANLLKDEGYYRLYTVKDERFSIEPKKGFHFGFNYSLKIPRNSDAR
jgi:hypothetical protein